MKEKLVFNVNVNLIFVLFICLFFFFARWLNFISLFIFWGRNHKIGWKIFVDLFFRSSSFVFIFGFVCDQNEREWCELAKTAKIQCRQSHQFRKETKKNWRENWRENEKPKTQNGFRVQSRERPNYVQAEKRMVSASLFGISLTYFEAAHHHSHTRNNK